MSDVLWIEDAEQLRDLIDTEPMVVVDFTAPAWCGPCVQFAPTFEAIAGRAAIRSDSLGRAVFVAVDIDKADWAMVEYGVRGVPNVQVFKNSEFVTHVAKTPQTRTALKFLAELTSV